jgi:hypothetical protein
VTIILDRNGTTKQNQDSDMMKLFFALFSERYPGKKRGSEGGREGGEDVMRSRSRAQT